MDSRGERENRSYQSRGRRACIAADTGRLTDRKTGGWYLNPRSPSNGVQRLPYRNQTCWLPRASCRSLVQSIVPMSMAGERWYLASNRLLPRSIRFSFANFANFVRSLLEFCKEMEKRDRKDKEILEGRSGSGASWSFWFN